MTVEHHLEQRRAGAWKAEQQHVLGRRSGHRMRFASGRRAPLRRDRGPRGGERAGVLQDARPGRETPMDMPQRLVASAIRLERFRIARRRVEGVAEQALGACPIQGSGAPVGKQRAQQMLGALDHPVRELSGREAQHRIGEAGYALEEALRQAPRLAVLAAVRRNRGEGAHGRDVPRVERERAPVARLGKPQ